MLVAYRLLIERDNGLVMHAQERPWDLSAQPPAVGRPRAPWCRRRCVQPSVREGQARSSGPKNQEVISKVA